MLFAWLISLLSLIFSFSLYAEPLQLKVQAEAAILFNPDNGAILYEKNIHDLHYPASTVKIATALYALQQRGDRLDDQIIADQEAIGWVTEEAKRRSNYSIASYLLVPGSTHIGIKKGEILTLRDLLYGMMLASGDDASNVIAQHISGSIPKFVEELNQFLQQIGCKDTTFYNPHGLHHPNQQTSAYDLAILTREALKNPLFREIVSTPRYTRPKTNKQEATTLIQSNKLLRSGQFYYPKAIGVKTGHLSLARNTFVGAAKDGERTLIAVLLKTDERKDIFLDSVKLFEAAFNQPKVQRTLLKAGPQKFALEIRGANKPLQTFIQEDIKIEYYPAEEPRLKSYLQWDAVKLPVAKNQKVGELSLKDSNGNEIKKVPLYALEEMKETWLQRVKNAIINSGWYLKVLGLAVILLFLGLFIFQLRR